MSERYSGKNRDKTFSKDRNCKCLDECLESANPTLNSNTVSILNKSFVDCYLKCSECCKDIDYVSRFSEKASKLLMDVYSCKSVGRLLGLVANYVNNLFEGVKQVFSTVFMINVRLLSRLAIHCSSKHLPLQISLAWDPVFNVPYVPSSSIKGVVRSYFMKNNIRIGGMEPEELFGTTEHQGELIFFDAYPVKCEGTYLVEADVIAPHYRELEGLIDEARSSPTPLVFPVIARGTELNIIVALGETLVKRIPSYNVNIIKELINNIASALEEGLGAKTSVGYGRIKVLNILSLEDMKANSYHSSD